MINHPPQKGKRPMVILAARCGRRDTWLETERWARTFIAQPARTATQLRHQMIVSDLLSQVEAQ